MRSDYIKTVKNYANRVRSLLNILGIRKRHMHHVSVIRTYPGVWGRIEDFPRGVDWDVNQANVLTILDINGHAIAQFSPDSWETVTTVGLGLTHKEDTKYKG